jgi:hypothetical protein
LPRVLSKLKYNKDYDKKSIVRTVNTEQRVLPRQKVLPEEITVKLGPER